MTAATESPIVVGVDGSTSSRQALDWAVQEATRRQLPLDLLCAWHSDYAAETVAPLVPSIEDDCRSIVDRGAAHARTDSPQLEIATIIVHAQAASALIEKTDGAQMLFI